ncbi:MAG TPA: xylose isomerase [Balneolaceae bacterium]|mgnify:CR=1 FL=1|nr:xylose isomerase [Balneolaceae bacterium]|tara:strand:- start:82722 stop:83654 length:933 start_codon:yes stop_codon:yes gene_type:complete
MNRRDFLKTSGLFTGACFTGVHMVPQLNTFDFRISLAEWSHHKEIFGGEFTNLDFPVIAKQRYDISAVEYVNQFFAVKATDKKYLKELKKRADDNGVQNVLIMIDNEGAISSTDMKVRDQAVENHYKWVEAAKFLGCHAIRINLFGAEHVDDWISASVDGLGKLTEFGAQHKIHVIVENHGGHSSHGARLAKVMKQVNSSWVGTLPDFGNFCVARENGEMWGAPCVEKYDLYRGVEELMPYAKGVSAKTFHFDEEGNEPDIDFMRLFTIIKKSGWNNGYVGIEYEGDSLEPAEGIKKTKALLERVRAKLA